MQFFLQSDLFETIHVYVKVNLTIFFLLGLSQNFQLFLNYIYIYNMLKLTQIPAIWTTVHSPKPTHGINFLFETPKKVNYFSMYRSNITIKTITHQLKLIHSTSDGSSLTGE